MPVSRLLSNQTTARICRTSTAFRTGYFANGGYPYPRLSVVIAEVDSPANEIDLPVVNRTLEGSKFGDELNRCVLEKIAQMLK